jgi:hypothetical protein
LGAGKSLGTGKETTMTWISRFRTPGEGEAVNMLDDTVIGRAPAPYHFRRSPESSAASGDHPEAHIAEEIKRRQVALAVRYVMAVRPR